MSLASLLIYFAVFGAVVWVAFWITDRAFKEPIKMPARAIVGVILLLVLLSWFVGRGNLTFPVLHR